MSIIFGILKEENERLKEAMKLYAERVEKLPRGTPWVKKRGERKYAYLAYHEEGTVHFDYVAPIPSIKYDTMLQMVKERNLLVTSLKNMRKDLMIIERTLRNVSRAK